VTRPALRPDVELHGRETVERIVNAWLNARRLPGDVGLAAMVVADLPRWLAAVEAALDPSGAPGSTNGGRGGIGTISRPTEAQAALRGPAVAHRDLVLGHLERAVSNLAAAHSAMGAFTARAFEGDTAIAVKAARCTGGPATAGWQRPECRELAVTRDGLCSACYQRRQYHEAKGAA
jgi:hypothetical protein